jgi:hypothetical protein
MESPGLFFMDFFGQKFAVKGALCQLASPALFVKESAEHLLF